MATTISASFKKLKENLEITGLQRSTVSTRQSGVRVVVEKDLVVLDSFLTGSYSKSTMVRPLSVSDIDIFVVLASKYFVDDGQANLLDRLKRTLLKTYTSTPKISRNGQAVTIRFTDFLVDVVPAFKRQGGGYLIPNSISKTWISTNPKTHVETLTQENQAHNGDLVPIIKMIKGWNRTINNSFVSFYLELLAIKIFKGVEITDIPSGMRYFFDKGREGIKYKVLDSAGYGDQVNPLSNCTNVANAVSRFETAYNRSMKAEQYAVNNNIESAVDEWRKIFGDYFPAYG